MTPKKARVRLKKAILEACVARGEAQWTNGYRAGNKAERDQLFEAEQKEWGYVRETEKAVELALRNYTRVIRTPKRVPFEGEWA